MGAPRTKGFQRPRLIVAGVGLCLSVRYAKVKGINLKYISSRWLEMDGIQAKVKIVVGCLEFQLNWIGFVG